MSLWGFSAVAPMGVWTGLRWRKLSGGDITGIVESTVRWSGGWLALGAPYDDPGREATATWLSTDGRTWEPFSLGAGSQAVVVAAVPRGDLVVAATLQMASYRCDERTSTTCIDLTGPLRLWSSSDGRAWTERVAPIDVSTSELIDSWVQPKMVNADRAYLLFMDEGRRTVLASADGLEWSVVPQVDPDRGPEFGRNNVGVLGSTIVGLQKIVTEAGEIRLVAWSSTDGGSWTKTRLPSVWAETAGGRLVAGADGLLAQGSTAGDGGPSIWWANAGDGWRELDGYPPVGTWVGEGAGSGGSADGFVVADGTRFVAYAGSDRRLAWTSSDGRAWTPIEVVGDGPHVGSGGYPKGWFVLTAFGMLFFGYNGSTWLAEPIG